MKKALGLTLLGLSMIIGGMVRAGAQSAATGPKLAFVDLQRTLNETKVGTGARNKLEGDKSAKQKALDVMKEDLKKEVAEFERAKVVMKVDAASRRQAEIQQKVVGLQDKFLQLQQDLSRAEAGLTRDIFVKASTVIKSIAARDGYSLVFEKSESALLYAAPAMDITAELNRRLDAGEGGK
jgi:outer membrane protein